MRVEKTNFKIRKNEKYGVYNKTDLWVESHHRSYQAALNKCKSRRVRCPECNFTVVLISKVTYEELCMFNKIIE